MEEHTILCVDDETNVLRALRRLLRREGHKIATTTTGREALDIIRNEEIALILVDQKVPELDSVGLLEQVKEITPDTLRIVLSSYAPATKIIDSINKGEVYRFVTKPWEDEEFKLIVKEALERYDLMRRITKQNQRIAEQNRELEEKNKLLAEQYEERAQDLTYSQQILGELPLPIIGTDPEGQIVFANQVAQQLFGEGPFGLFEIPISEVMPPEVVKFVEDHYNVGSENAPPDLDGVIDFLAEEDCFRIQCQPLEGQLGVRGYLLTFHKQFQIGGENQ